MAALLAAPLLAALPAVSFAAISVVEGFWRRSFWTTRRRSPILKKLQRLQRFRHMRDSRGDDGLH